MGTPAHCPASWSGCPEYDTLDALGLVANYFIQLPSSPSSGSCGNITVDAAMLALTDSVYVQDWAQGVQCYLDVFGAIAQNFRGPVGTFGGNNTGYQKQYVYDDSLTDLWPPYFLSATSATWAPTSYAEGKPGSANRALLSDAGSCGTQC